jgi:hypothetical protein
MYQFVSQVQGFDLIYGDILEQRMQILSSKEEKELATLMRLSKNSHYHLEGQKGQQGELIFLKVLCTLRTPSKSQPLVMMRRRAHTDRNPLLPSHLQQLLSAKGRAKISTQLAMSIVRAPERMTMMMTMRAYQFLNHIQLRMMVRLTSMLE